VDKRGTNLAALDTLNTDRRTTIEIRRNKYLITSSSSTIVVSNSIIRPKVGF
jgi:hypothetical protein